MREYGNWDRLVELLNLDLDIKMNNSQKNSTYQNISTSIKHSMRKER